MPKPILTGWSAFHHDISLRGINAITFDVGGTLIAPWPSVGHIYAEIAAQNGYKDIEAEVLNRRFNEAWQTLDNFQHNRSDWEALVDATFQGLVNAAPSRTFFSKLYNRFTEPDTWRVFDDVLPTLHRLKTNGFRVGIVSNWDDRLRPLLQALKLASYFDVIVVSCEVGFAKPSRHIFERASRELGFPLAEILHICDSLEMDLRGAGAAGMRASLLERGRTDRQPNIIGSLSEL